MSEDSRSNHTSLPERGEVTKYGEPSPGIQLLGATTFDHLLASKWSRHSPYDLENVKGCWEHRWKASP